MHYIDWKWKLLHLLWKLLHSLLHLCTAMHLIYYAANVKMGGFTGGALDIKVPLDGSRWLTWMELMHIITFLVFYSKPMQSSHISSDSQSLCMASLYCMWISHREELWRLSWASDLHHSAADFWLDSSLYCTEIRAASHSKCTFCLHQLL